MAITLSSAPTTGIQASFNRLGFTFSASAGETFIQVRLKDSGSSVIGTLKPVPFNSSNEAKVFVGAILQKQFSLDDNTVNVAAAAGSLTDLSQSYTLEYRDTVGGSWTAIGSTYYFAPTIRQIGSEPNLNDFSPTLASGGVVTTEGAFLTDFTRKKLFWWSDTPTPASTADVAVFQSQNVFASQDATFMEEVRVRWYSGGVLQDTDLYTFGTNYRHFAIPIYLANKCYQYQEVIVDILSSSGDVIMAITYDIERVCNNPYAFKFLNDYGAWETWVFEGRSPLAIESEGIGDYSLYPTTLSSATETGRFTKKRISKEQAFTADSLTLNQAEVLQGLLSSPNVRMFTGTLAGGSNTDEWQGVKVTGGYTIDTYDTLHKFEFTAIMPDTYTLSN